MSSNYPEGVTNSHPHFNQNDIVAEVQCEREEADVLPAFIVTQALDELLNLLDPKRRQLTPHEDLLYMVTTLRGRLDGLEQNREYECPFEDAVEVEVREDAEWQCPICGATHDINSLPEGPDPDRAWDDRHGN